jgi:hypothetical protein
MTFDDLVFRGLHTGADAIVFDVQACGPVRGIFCYADDYASFELQAERHDFLKTLVRVLPQTLPLAGVHRDRLPAPHQRYHFTCERLEDLELDREGLSVTIYLAGGPALMIVPPRTVGAARTLR